MIWLIASIAVAGPFAWSPPLEAPPPHAALIADPPEPAEGRAAFEPAAAPALAGGPDLVSYGYLGHWSANLDRVPWHALSHVALFAAEVDRTGHLVATERWRLAPEAVRRGHAHDVRVHLTVACFDGRTLGAVLGSSPTRTTLVNSLREWVERTGAHGVNVDFEGVPASRRDALTSFVRQLDKEIGEVVVAVPAAGWWRSYDLQGLSRVADLYVMAYDYHWGGSSHAGPVDPLRAGRGTVWAGVNAFSVTRTIDDVVAAGADPAHVILGLPLYGRRWPVDADTVPAKATGQGRALTFDRAAELAGSVPRRLEPDAQSLRLYHDGTQVWYGDVETLRQRIVTVRQRTPFAGVGFWTLNYASDPALWRMVNAERRLTKPRVTTMMQLSDADNSRPNPGWGFVAVGAIVLGLLCRLGTRASPEGTRCYSGRRGESR